MQTVKVFRSLIWLAILFNTSISRYVGMCGATNNSIPFHCVKIRSYFWSFFPYIRTKYESEITFHAVIARGCNKIIWWKREQVAINWALRNSSLHKLHQSFRNCLRRVTRCQGETLYYPIKHRFNPCLFYSYRSHCLSNMLHKLYSDV